MELDPTTLIGKQVPAADGGDYGHLVVGYDPHAEDLLVVPIKWSTGAPMYPDRTEPQRLDRWKASYRYELRLAR